MLRTLTVDRTIGIGYSLSGPQGTVPLRLSERHRTGQGHPLCQWHCPARCQCHSVLSCLTAQRGADATTGSGGKGREGGGVSSNPKTSRGRPGGGALRHDTQAPLWFVAAAHTKAA